MAVTRVDGPSYSDQRYRKGTLNSVPNYIRDYHLRIPPFRPSAILNPYQVRDMRGARNRIAGQQVRYFPRNYQPLHEIRSTTRRLGGRLGGQ